MSNSWLCKLSSRWDQADPGPAGLADLTTRPETEALRLWLAHRARSRVEGLAQVQSSRQPGDRRELDEYVSDAAVLAFIRDLLTVLEPPRT